MIKIKAFPNLLIFGLFAVFTFLIAFVSHKFSLNDYIANPQFENFTNFNACIDFIKDQGRLFWFKVFFYIDFIWAFLLLLCIFRVINFISNKKRIRSIRAFFIFSFVAYLLDITENLSYLFQNANLLQDIVPLKKGAYALVVLTLIYTLYKRYLQDKNRDFYFFLITSSFSILIISIIVILVTMVDQGGTLVVQLVSDWHQVALMFFLLNFLAIIISHYPIYMQIWNVLDKPFTPDGLRMVMAKTSPIILGFGIIYFVPKGDKEFDPFVVKLLRRSLGILLKMSMFYVVFFVAAKFFEWQMSTLFITAILTLILLLFFHYVERVKRKCDQVLYGKHKGSKIESAGKITRLLKWYPFVFILGLLSTCFATVISAGYQWNRITVIAILVVLFINNVSYIYFRLARPYLRYIFYSENLKSSNPNLIDDDTLIYFKGVNKPVYPIFNTLIYKVGQKLAYLSDNRKYLRYMRFGGLLSLFFLIFLNLYPLWGYVLNPLNVILLYVIFYYSVIIIFLKHLLYYSKTVVTPGSKEGLPFRSFLFYQSVFKYLLPVLMLAFGIWGFYSTAIGNDLHTLTLVKESESLTPEGEQKPAPLTNIESFISNYDPVVKNDTVNAFFIASYGGGLKANLWNLLILNQLDHQSSFLKNTICFSGVSGGAIGIGNYLRIHENFKDFDSRKLATVAVGESNLLSTEIAYLLGADFIRRYLPVNNIFSDRGRSYYSMMQHAQHTGGIDDFNKVSFRSAWSQTFRENGYFPALIINSTSTNGKQGVALSVFTAQTVIPASDDILLFRDKNKSSSLTYYGALSTSNRFPFVSPAAKIPGKGYYLDGGYFENSGLLSAREFYHYVMPGLKKQMPDTVAVRPVFVNIINSKEYYALSKLKEWGISLNNDNGLSSGQLSTIISTLVSTEKLPRYITESIEKEDGKEVMKIMMPHKLDYDYVIKILGGEPENPLRLIRLLNEQNKQIDMALRENKDYDIENWGVVTPPLSRLLGKVAVKYQQAMVTDHPEVIQQIQKIKDLVKPE